MFVSIEHDMLHRPDDVVILVRDDGSARVFWCGHCVEDSSLINLVFLEPDEI